MKRHLISALALSLLLALCACSSAKGAGAPATVDPGGVPVEAVLEPAPDTTIREILKLVPEVPLEVCGEQLLYHVEPAYEGELNEPVPGKVILSYGSATAVLGDTEWGCESYVAVLSNDELIVYATLGFSSDWHETIPVQLHSGSVTAYAPVDGYIAAQSDITGADHCRLQSRVNVFGTYGSRTPYVLTENGLVAEGSYVQLINEKQVEDGSYLDGFPEDSYAREICDQNGRHILRLRRALTLHADNGEMLTLSAGSVLWPVGFDANAWQFFVEFAEGHTGWFEYGSSPKGWGSSIEGIDEEEWFEFLPYAG